MRIGDKDKDGNYLEMTATWSYTTTFTITHQALNHWLKTQKESCPRSDLTESAQKLARLCWMWETHFACHSEDMELFSVNYHNYEDLTWHGECECPIPFRATKWHNDPASLSFLFHTATRFAWILASNMPKWEFRFQKFPVGWNLAKEYASFW